MVNSNIHKPIINSIPIYDLFHESRNFSFILSNIAIFFSFSLSLYMIFSISSSIDFL